jgi:hypothetical protein
MRKDVREFIRRLEAVGLTVESTPGHYRVVRDASRCAKQTGCRSRCHSLPTRSAGKAAIVELRKLGIDL